MENNFDLVKYLKENHLGPHSILGGYVDLHALKEESQLNEASLELDWASGINSLKAKCKKHGLTCKVVKEFGPAGGNPLVKIIGSKDSIISFLKDGYADADQLEDYTADIKEVEDNSENNENAEEFMEAEDLEGYKMVDKLATDNKKVADAFLKPLVTVYGEDNVKMVNKDGVYKFYTKDKKKLNKEADYGNNQPVDEVPYGDGEGRLDGFGDEFDQVAPVEEANSDYYDDNEDPFAGMQDNDDRFAGLGGDQIKAAIKNLMDDGFDTREIAQFVVDTIRGFKSFKG